MPLPAVMTLSSPGRIGWSVPRLSWWTSSPDSSHVTVWSPMWGWGPSGTDGRRRGQVVDEAPRPDGPSGPPGQRPSDEHPADVGIAAVGDLDTGRWTGGLGLRADVVGGEGSTMSLSMPGRAERRS